MTITTVYTGAQPELIQGFITAPIAAAVATTENIDYVTSQSTPSASVVSVHMKLGSNPDVALTEVLSKVQGVRGQLPDEAEDPVIVKGTGMQFALMYLAAREPEHDPGAADRVSRAGHPAADVDDRGRRRDPDHRRLELRDAGLDRPAAARGARRDRHRGADGDPRLELPRGARQDRERVRRLQHHHADDAADAGGLRRAAAEIRGRPGRAAARRRAHRAGARGAAGGRHLQRQAGHLHRRLPDPGGQPAQHRRGGGARAAGDQQHACRRA